MPGGLVPPPGHTHLPRRELVPEIPTSPPQKAERTWDHPLRSHVWRVGTHPLDIPTHLEETWYQRYQLPLPKDMGPPSEVPCLGSWYPPPGHTRPPRRDLVPEIPTPPQRTWDHPCLGIGTHLPGHIQPRRVLVPEIPTPKKDMGSEIPTQPLWTDRHLRKHYLPATALAGSNNA